MSNKNPGTVIELPIEWNIPDSIIARYATNMVVQRAENEYIISFFEIKPPMFLGTPEQIVQQTKNLKSISANCVAQIIVAADKMPSFVEALGRNLNRSSEDVEIKVEPE